MKRYGYSPLETRRNEVVLVMGADVQEMRRTSSDAVNLHILSANDLQEARRQANNIRDSDDADHLRLLRIDLHRRDRHGWMFMNPVGSSVVSLISDAQTLGIACGAIISSDASTNCVALFNEIRVVLRARGYCVIEHVPGWEAVGSQSGNYTDAS
ncbi:MAG TPA: hypothetical protein VGC05_18605 [Mycobacterium sp.]